MFLTDSICNFQLTEPIWFRLIRRYSAVILLIILIQYSIFQIAKINAEASIIVKFDMFQSFKIKMRMCANDVKFNVKNLTPSDEMSFTTNNHTLYCQSVLYNSLDGKNVTVTAPFNIDDDTINMSEAYKLNYPYDYNLDNHNITSSLLNKNKNILFLSLESFQFDNYLEKFQKDLVFFRNSNNSTLESNYFLLHPGQSFIISLKPMVASDYEPRYISPDYEPFYIPDYEVRYMPSLVYKLELNPQLEQLQKLESNEIQFGVSSRSNTFKFEEYKDYSYTDLITNLGGFFAAIIGIFILSFGMPKHQPWGMAQKYWLTCYPCRKSFRNNFARRYVSLAGIPLAERVNKRPLESSLEERLQVLETLLQEYYFDDYFLSRVKNHIINQEKAQEKYIKLEKSHEKCIKSELEQQNKKLEYVV